MNTIHSYIKLYFLKKKWRKQNRHNYTKVKCYFPIDKVKVGIGTYGEIQARFFGGKNESLEIGNYVSIGPNVFFCVGGEHELNRVMTYPFENKLFGRKEAISKGPIIIEDDVWIGCNVTILSGVHISKGAVIAAGSVIHKDVPSYAIAGTNGVIRYRFPKTISDKLLKLDYTRLDSWKLKENISTLTQIVDESNIDSIVNILKDCISHANIEGTK